MIEIYTKKQDSPDWIILNGMYFNVYTGNEEISEYEAKLIQIRGLRYQKLTWENVGARIVVSGQIDKRMISADWIKQSLR